MTNIRQIIFASSSNTNRRLLPISFLYKKLWNETRMYEENEEHYKLFDYNVSSYWKGPYKWRRKRLYCPNNNKMILFTFSPAATTFTFVIKNCFDDDCCVLPQRIGLCFTLSFYTYIYKCSLKSRIIVLCECINDNAIKLEIINV